MSDIKFKPKIGSLETIWVNIPKERYIIVSCFRGGSTEDIGTGFIDAANTRKKEIERQIGTDNKSAEIEIYDIDNIKNLVEIINRKNIKQLDVFSHGGTEHLVIGSGKGTGKRELLYAEDLKKFCKDAFFEDATIVFWGCKTASSPKGIRKIVGKRCIAEEFAHYFKKCKVIGFTGGAIQAPSPDSKPDDRFVHKKGEDVWFVTWGNQKVFYEKD